LLPLTVSGKEAAWPAVMLPGDRDNIAGTGSARPIVKVSDPEGPPPGVELLTATLAVPATPRSE
jgi:hypothetical protein